MTLVDTDPESAAARSVAARKKLAGTLAELQSRLSPKALARDAVQELRETGQELAREGLAVAKRHPLTLAGVTAGLMLFIVRRPISNLLHSASDATAATVASLNNKRPSRRKARPRKGTPT